MCIDDEGFPSVTLSGNFAESPLELTCTDRQYSGSITISQPQTNLEATQSKYTSNASVILDTTAPTVAIVSPANGSLVGAQVTITGTCEASLPVVLTGDLQNTVNTLCTESSEFSVSVEFNLLPTVGQRQLVATQTDLAGNVGTNTATYDFNNTTPTQPNLTLNISPGHPDHPSTPPVSADYTPTLTGTVGDADGGVIEIFTDAQCATAAVGSQTIPIGGNLNITNINFAQDGSADGLQRFYARVTGPNGVQNPGGCFNTTLSYRLDTQAPNLVVASPQSGGAYYSGSSLIFSGSCEAGTPVSITLDGVTHSAPCSSNIFSIPLVLPNTTGTTTANFQQTDLANLDTDVTVNFSLTLGPPADPQIHITSPAAQSVIDVSAPVTVSGTCTAHPAISASITFTGDIVGNATTNCISDGSAYGGTFTTDLQFSTVTTPAVTAKQTNLETQVEYTSSITYQVAPANPTSLTLNVDAGHPNYTTTPRSSKDYSPTLTGQVSLAGLGVLSVYSNSSCSSLILNHNVPANGQINITLPSYSHQGTDDGVKEFYAILKNAQGTPNPGGCTLVDSYRLDTIAPTLTLTSHTNESTYYRNSAQTLSGECESHAPLQILMGTQSFQPTCTNGNFSQNVIFPSTGNSVEVRLSQSDAANNSTQMIHVYTLEMAPASSIELAFNTPAENTVVDPTVLTTITGTCTYHADMSPVVLSGDIQNSTNAPCNSDGTDYGGTFSADVKFDVLSAPVLTATQTNSSNQDTLSIHRQFYVAPSQPTLTLTTNPSGPRSKDTSPQITGTVELANEGTIQIYEDAVCAVLTQTASISSTGHISLNVNYDNDGSDDGLHSYYAIVTSSQGITNASGCFNTGLSYTLDTQAPNLTLTSITEGASLYAGSAQIFSGQCEADHIVDINLNGDTHSLACNIGGQFSRSITLPTTPGTLNVTYSQTDAAGNTTLKSLNITLTLPPPTQILVAITSPAQGSTVTHLMGTHVTGTCTYHPRISQVELEGSLQGNQLVPCVPDGNSDYSGTFEAQVQFVPVNQPQLRARQSNLDTNFVQQSGMMNYVLLTLDNTFTIHLDPGNPNLPSDPPISADTTPSISGTLPEVAGLTVALFNNSQCTGAPLASQVVPQSGDISLSANFNNNGSDDGPHSFYAQISSLELEFESDCLDLEMSYVLDTQAPNVNITSHNSSSSYLVSSTQTLSGVCETGLNVELTVGSTDYDIMCTSGAFAQTITLPSSPTTLNIAYSQTDAANNQTSQTLALTVEAAQPPSDPTDFEFDLTHGNPELPTTPLTSNSTSLVITGKADNANGALIRLYENDTCTSNPVVSGIVNGDEFELFVIYETEFQDFDGLHRYYAQVEAVGGVQNPGGCVDTGLAYTLDTLAPEVFLQSPLSGADFYATHEIEFKGGCESGAPIELTFNSTIPQTETIECVDEEFSAQITLPEDLGNMNFSYRSVDAAGNESSISNRTIVLLLPPPKTLELAITSPATNSAVSAGAQSITGTCTVHSEMGPVVLTGDIGSTVSVNCSPDGVTAYSGTFTTSVNFLDQATLQLNATQINNYDNNTASVSATYVIPPSDPALNLVLQPGNPNFPDETPPHTSGTTVGVTGEVIKGAGGTLKIFSDNTCLTELGQTVISSTNSVDLNLNFTQNGLYELYALVTMPSSHTNPSGCMNTGLSFILDTQAPQVTLTSHSGGTNYQTGSAQTLEGTCEPGLPVSLNVGGTPYTALCATGNYSQAVTFPSTPQTLLITFAQTDKAGNTSIGGTLSLNVVAPPPGAPVLDLIIANPAPGIIPTSKTHEPVLQGTVTHASGGVMQVYGDSQCQQLLGTSDPISSTGEVSATIELANDGSDDGRYDFYVVVTANGQSTSCIDTERAYILDTQVSGTLSDSLNPETYHDIYDFAGYKALYGTCSDIGGDILITLDPGTQYSTSCSSIHTFRAIVHVDGSPSIDLTVEFTDQAGNSFALYGQYNKDPSPLPEPEHAVFIDHLAPNMDGTIALPPESNTLFGRCTLGAHIEPVVQITGDLLISNQTISALCYSSPRGSNIPRETGYFSAQLDFNMDLNTFDILVQQSHSNPSGPSATDSTTFTLAD